VLLKIPVAGSMRLTGAAPDAPEMPAAQLGRLITWLSPTHLGMILWVIVSSAKSSSDYYT